MHLGLVSGALVLSSLCSLHLSLFRCAVFFTFSSPGVHRSTSPPPPSLDTGFAVDVVAAFNAAGVTNATPAVPMMAAATDATFCHPAGLQLQPLAPLLPILRVS